MLEYFKMENTLAYKITVFDYLWWQKIGLETINTSTHGLPIPS